MSQEQGSAEQDWDKSGNPWSQPLRQARALAERSRWHEAARLFHEVLRHAPEHTDALEGLGLAALQLREPGQAIEWFNRAKQGAPRSARVLGLLATAQRLEGRLPEAIATYQQALALESRPELWLELGQAEHAQGALERALHSYEKSVDLKSDYAPGWTLLAQVLLERGEVTRALEACRRALSASPWLGEAHLAEGDVLAAAGTLPQAAVSWLVASTLPRVREEALARVQNAGVGSVEQALVVKLLAAPTDAESYLTLARQCVKERPITALRCLELAFEHSASSAVGRELALLLRQLGHAAAAQRRLVQALDCDPGDAASYRLLGSWLAEELNFVCGEARWQQLLTECPDDVVALVNLGVAAQRMGRPSEAVPLHQRASALIPNRSEPYINLAAALCDYGNLEQANLAHERALELEPHNWAVHSNRLLNAHFELRRSPEELFARHQAFGRALAEWVGAPEALSNRDWDPERRLRIGYVSPDLREHPIAYFLEPVLREHDRSQVEVYCYSDVTRRDTVSTRLERLACRTVHCAGQGDEALAARIAADRIDLLIDLAGHGLSNRLPVFARRPSPVQLAWLGYFDTTGLASIDYRLADVHSVPLGDERRFVEQIVRLPRTASCFEPPPSPAPKAPPCIGHGRITFGCFSNPTKISRDAVAVFGRTLREVPGSRLLFKYHTFQDAGVAARFRRWFAEEGIAPERLAFQGHAPLAQYLAAFNSIDIAFDPFPYSGETTALFTLWMGVPLITRAGKTMAQRLASRVLSVLGLDAWIAAGDNDYVRIARDLASSPERLAQLRQELRPQLQASPLLDHAGFTRDLEGVYRSLWARACAARRE
jgi:protein O-GlcNAc transferase